MASKATGEKRRVLHKALLISASLVMVLATAPVVAQETPASVGTLEEPGATSYQYDAPATIGEAPGAAYQDGETGGGFAPLEVIPSEPAPGQPPDPGHPPGVVDPGVPDDAQRGQPPGEPTGSQDLAQQAARFAQQAAQEAQLAASDAEGAASTVQQSSASPEDVQVAQQAAQEAQLAASDAQEAAELAQQAAAQEDTPAAQEASQEARQAAEEAEQTSGAVQQVAQQVVENFGGTGDLKEAYTRALQVARSSGAESDNVASAAEPDRKKASSNSEEPVGEAGGEETTSGKAANGKGDRKAAAGETEPEADIEDTGSSNSAVTTAPARGGFPLLLGGGVVLAAGAAFVARKIIWP